MLTSETVSQIESTQTHTKSLTEQDIMFNNCISHLTAKLSQIKANEQLKQANKNTETTSPDTNGIRIVAFQPVQKRVLTENIYKNEKEVPNPKPRTIITLPHLIGRQKNGRTTTGTDGTATKTPIIIRERLICDPDDNQYSLVLNNDKSPSVDSFTSNVSVNSGQSNQRVSSSP